MCALKVSDVVVVGSHMGFEAAGFTEALVAVFTPDLSPNAMSSKMISQTVAVSVAFVTDVALSFLAFVSGLMNSGSTAVIKPCRAPITVPNSTNANALGASANPARTPSAPAAG